MTNYKINKLVQMYFTMLAENNLPERDVTHLHVQDKKMTLNLVNGNQISKPINYG